MGFDKCTDSCVYHYMQPVFHTKPFPRSFAHFESSLYILNISPLSEVGLENIDCSKSVVCLFKSLKSVSFAEGSF